jgi:hypothetical protein
MAKDKRYDYVAGKGQVLEDGTWWTNCLASVGEICTLKFYDLQIQDGKWWAADIRTECVETAVADGNNFARWKELELSEFKECIMYTNCTLAYKQ